MLTIPLVNSYNGMIFNVLKILNTIHPGAAIRGAGDQQKP